MQKAKLWGGRFSTSTNDLMESFSESVSFDWRLYKHDIAGSIAHARMLADVGVLTADEFNKIEAGLKNIETDIEGNSMDWKIAYEDVHMNIEAMLTERIGEAGKKLHTARSRNDQVATDIRLFVRDSIDRITNSISRAQSELAQKAATYHDTVMPGFTHMQTAQPVTFGHHMLAWNEMLERDYSRFIDCRKRLNISPLGCAALAGTSFSIDRHMTSTELGFDGPSANSLDSVSDRDFAMEFNAAAAITMVHLSRMAEELVLWSSDAFGFVDLGEAFCTGSSIMPQKKNPDMAELTRGKSARVIGNLTSLLVLMKAQPLTYNRDNQEDKEPLFDSIDTLEQCLQIFAAMLPGMQPDAEKLYEAANKGYATATDLADYLVRKGLAFRDAHEVVGNTVKHAVEKGVDLADLDLETLRDFSSSIDDDVYTILTLEGSVNARDHVGGTAPSRVKKAARDVILGLEARRNAMAKE
ncbi:MAG: argininosuccinate lyase [Pseudomonadota bacterium]